MEPFTQLVVQAIRRIPPGKVMTYGQIAAHAGSPGAARQVARLLHSMSAKYNLPWHRVINAEGRISIQDEKGRCLQEQLLRDEGVEMKGAKVDLTKFRFDPGQDGF
ncbi:MGMT family protein [Planococcus sp. CAU13]|uniref:MGMT family protein n=1 Tax=Planococcus sp. CAU13 TaxID=1541197 RepID=UPI000530061E|nr:MGMT family protein [Planococcus sp. CAU13]